MGRSALLDVLEGREPERRPVWLMRQAGRYLPEYRATRARAGSFLELCYAPALACEVTLQPLQRFDLDAAILFSDILVVPHAMGLKLAFVENEGPKLETVSDLEAVRRLLSGDGAEQFTKVYETVARVKAALKPGVGFIGFCGAPWTVASYMIEGGSSDRKKALAIAIDNPPWFAEMMQRLVEVSSRYLLGQINAGVEVVQIFDSWAGDVPSLHRQRVVFDPIAAIVSRVRALHPDFPVIAFGRGIAGDHALLAAATGANAVGVEENADLSQVLRSLPAGCAVQGNLAPECMSDQSVDLAAAVKAVVADVPKGRHIFNLGHGIRPDAKPERVTELVSHIRTWDR
jgi:uroporphyrinogen decarboxylase